MIDGPLGGAAFNNEFGRPNLAGYFRVYEQTVGGQRRGYHKPIMIAGGLGSIAATQTRKIEFPAGTLLIQLGGPGMRIGMGGGAASSMAAGANATELDFDSVQRGNPEIQRRAQEVINHCAALGEANPILAIHDVGAGGISNAFPELVDGAGRGARFDLRAVPLEESGLAPKEIWCNESQERYVMAVAPDALPLFDAMCVRERCPYAVVGVATDARALQVGAIDLDVGPSGSSGAASADADGAATARARRAGHRHAARRAARQAAEDAPRRAPRGRVEPAAVDLTGVALQRVAFDVLRHPTVASKRFLITIGDRTVGGLSSRDPMVGPWQVPVADCAVTLADYRGFRGEAMAIGERTPLAAVDAPASGRMAVGEAITNLLAAPIELERVKLSCNWMAACSDDPNAPGDDAALYDTVRAVGLELCPALGISVPVGKDSLSMRTRWRDGDAAKQVTAPVSLVVTAFATLADVRPTLTPQLQPGDTTLVLIDLGNGQQRLGGSMLAQVLGQFGDRVPDLDDPQQLKALVEAINALRAAGLLLAYHDRSDGGLWAAVCEMAFAGHLGAEPERRPARHRRRRHRRQPRGVRRLEELGRAGRRAARRADLARAVQRRARRRDPGADRAPRRGDADAAPLRPEPAQPLHRQAERARRRRGLARCEGGVQRAAARPAPDLGRGQLAHRAAARQPGLRRCRARGGRARRRSGAACPRRSRRCRSTMRHVTH